MILSFTMYQTGSGEYYFRLKTPAGEWLMTGNRHASLQACKNDIASLRLHAGRPAAYERRMTLTICFEFVIRNPEGYMIARSQAFATAQLRDKTMALVKSLVREAVINDLT